MKHFVLHFGFLAVLQLSQTIAAGPLLVFKDGTVADSSNIEQYSHCLRDTSPDTCKKVQGRITEGQSIPAFYFEQAKVFYKNTRYNSALKFFNLSRKSGGINDSCLFYMSESAFRLKKFKLGLNIHYSINDSSGVIKSEDLLFQRLRFFEYLGMDKEAEKTKLELVLSDVKLGRRKKTSRISLWAYTSLYYDIYEFESSERGIKEHLFRDDAYAIEAFYREIGIAKGEEVVGFSEDGLISEGWSHDMRFFLEWLPFKRFPLSIQPELGVYYDMDSTLLKEPEASVVSRAGVLVAYPLMELSHTRFNLSLGMSYEDWYSEWWKRTSLLGWNFYYRKDAYAVLWKGQGQYVSGNRASWKGYRANVNLTQRFQLTNKVQLGMTIRGYLRNSPSIESEDRGGYIAFCEGLESGQSIASNQVRCYSDSLYQSVLQRDPFSLGSDTYLDNHYLWDSTFTIVSKEPSGYYQIGSEMWLKIKITKRLDMKLGFSMYQIRIPKTYYWSLYQYGSVDSEYKKYFKFNREEKTYYYSNYRAAGKTGKNFILYEKMNRTDYRWSPYIEVTWDVFNRTSLSLTYRFQKQKSNLIYHPEVYPSFKAHNWTLSVQQHIF